MYLNNDEFTALVLAYLADREAHKEKFAEAVTLIAVNILKGFRFKGLDIDDAIQECVMLAIQKADRYEIGKGKAFNFFTTVILNHCRHLYRTEGNFNRLKLKYAEKVERRYKDSLRR